jgi:hypothetical protein
MKHKIITEKQLNLIIGDCTIRLSFPAAGQTEYYLPYSAERFLESKATYQPAYDIDYLIEFEDSFTEPEDEPVAGFDKGPFPYRVYRIDTGGYLWVRKNRLGDIQFVYKISEDWSSWKLFRDVSGSLGTESFAELAYIFAYSILNKDGIMFHGVVMEWEDMGIIVCAHSGVGKTTHTRMWRDHEDALILNGDRALCCKEEGKWYAYGAPWSGSSGEYLNRRVPLNAVVVLEQAELNEASVLTPVRGALELIQLAFAPTWEEKLLNASLDSIDSIAQNIPVFKLKCKPDIEAVAVLKEELKKLAEVRKENKD